MKISPNIYHLLLTIFCLLPLGLHGQSVVTHNVASGNLTIPGSSTNNYVITGTTTLNKVIIQSGYQGTVTLQNLDMFSNSTASSGYGASGNSCITVEGQNGYGTNLAPVTKVYFILDGDNQLYHTGDAYCALQVNQGAQVHFSAVDPANHASGKLYAASSTTSNGAVGGAGIGSPYLSASGAQGAITADLIVCSGTTLTSPLHTGGGNIIISSGSITAHGQHGAGIGGGRAHWYDGTILIYGGVVQATSGYHSAGIGSGCPTGSGLRPCSTPNSAIIVLPPATITAAGAQTSGLDPALGLAGTRLITYMNDPNKPIITVHTSDYRPYTDIYLDLTETPHLGDIFAAIGISLDLTKYKLGTTDALGVLTFNAEFQNNTTFFTEATNGSGVPYLPVIRTVTGSSTTLVDIELPLSTLNIAVVDYPSTPLMEGYSSLQAATNAFRVQVSYTDATCSRYRRRKGWLL